MKFALVHCDETAGELTHVKPDAVRGCTPKGPGVKVISQ